MFATALALNFRSFGAKCSGIQLGTSGRGDCMLVEGVGGDVWGELWRGRAGRGRFSEWEFRNREREGAEVELGKVLGAARV